jgi:hypothetical protein
MTVVLPVENKRRALVRTLWEASLQTFGPTAALGRIWGFTHPTVFEREIEHWREKVTVSANDHEERICALESWLDPQFEISDLALDLAFWICGASANGLQKKINWKSVISGFEDCALDKLEEAAAELSHLGFLKINSVIGRPVDLLEPQPELFWAFDEAAVGLHTRDDAYEIAMLWLQDSQFWRTSSLHEHLGWELRRLNPPLFYVLQFVKDGFVSREMQPDYPTKSIRLAAGDRFLLKRFVEASHQV